jgi:uncharacterized FlgJ-related protein
MKKFTLLLLLTAGSFVTTGFVMVSNVDTKKQEIAIDSALNEDNVYKTLIKCGIKYPEIVMSQIMLESSNLTSRLCLKNNNLLGMTVPSKRSTLALNKSGYAKYKSWFESVLDYKLYQDYILSKNNLDTKKKYIAFLNRNYAKDKRYKNTITSMSKEYEIKNTYYLGGI